MSITIYQVDSFASEAFKGNPAGVCVLDEPADETWMRNVAMEMNLSETAFLHRVEDGFSLRWFTPAVEVDLCGHATLASAHILWERGFLPADETARFHTKSGALTVVRKGDWLEMDFPAEPARETDGIESFQSAIGGAPIVFLGRNRMDHIIEVESEKIVRNLKPDMAAVKSITDRGLIVTATADADDIDFVSRFFAPAAGIDEDPVTGSSHCCLTPYWTQKLGKKDMTAYQASARGGVLRVSANGDRVKISGQAITVMKIELF